MKADPKRGEVWVVNWNPARVSEQAGIRPVLIIQNDIGNERLVKKLGQLTEKNMLKVDKAIKLSLDLS